MLHHHTTTVSGSGMSGGSLSSSSTPRTIANRLAKLWKRPEAVVKLGVILVLINLFLINIGGLLLYLHISSAVKSVASISPSALTQLDIPNMLERQLDPSILLTIHSMYHKTVKELPRLHIRSLSNTRSAFSLDVSTNMEFGLIWQRIHQYGISSIPRERQWVIDVGAMDGLSGSNSWNFIEEGWSAVLCEPFPRHLAKIKENHHRTITEPRLGQVLAIEPVAISDKDGETDFYLYDDASQTSNSISGSREPHRIQSKIRVQTLSVRSLTQKHNIPKHFGVLTIDAEGVGDVILNQFLDEGYRPQFIIYEFSWEVNKDIDSHRLPQLGYQRISTFSDNVWELSGPALEKSL